MTIHSKVNSKDNNKDNSSMNSKGSAKLYSWAKTGQAIAEYLILTALIAVASIGIVQVISQNMRGKLNQVNGAIVGEKVDFSGNKNTREQIKMIDLGNFNDTNKEADSK